MTQGALLVAGPPGYCIDRSTLRDEGARAFVLLGSCAGLGGRGSADAPPGEPGLLTASVTASEAGADASVELLAAYLASEEGRRALARGSEPADVEILDTVMAEDAVYVLASDPSIPDDAGLTEDYWRGLFAVRGRIVSIAVQPLSERPMSRDSGLRTAQAFAARIIAENTGPAVASLAVDRGTTTTTTGDLQ